MSDRPFCGRPTQRGKPCRFKRHQLRYFDPLGWAPAACKTHLTPAEWEEVYRIERAYEERRKEVERREATAILANAGETVGFFARIDRSCHADSSCEEKRVAWLVTIDLPDPVACYGHLTEEQRQAYDGARAAVQARFDRLTQEPACWSWLAPEPREYANEQEADAALHEWQAGRGCAICSSPGTLVEDHDHATGLVRGNLCHSCNIKEGWGNDRPPFVKYRERPPAAILGVRVRYWSPFHGLAEPEKPMSDEDWRAAKAAVDTLTLPHPEDLTRTETTS